MEKIKESPYSFDRPGFQKKNSYVFVSLIISIKLAKVNTKTKEIF